MLNDCCKYLKAINVIAQPLPAESTIVLPIEGNQMVSPKDGFTSPSGIVTNTISANDIIHQIKPVVIPRISSVANMAWCERAAYDISFLGLQSNYLPGAGDIGSSVHRIVIKSMLEIVQSMKEGKRLSKSDATDVFLRNAREEVEINWKFYVLSGIEQPLPV
jgi:hypothetical protein